MAVNETRDMHTELMLGTTDGTYKSRTIDRGGDIDPFTNPHDLPPNFHQEDTPVSLRHQPAGEFRKARPGRGPTRRSPLR